VVMRRYLIGAGSIGALMRRLDEAFAPTPTQERGFVCYSAFSIGDGTIETISAETVLLREGAAGG
jgi:hypothetical protein